MRSLLLSLFILLNLTVVLTVNCPGPLARVLARGMKRLSPEQSYRLQLLRFRLYQFANMTGLDAKWEMFSNVKGDDWRYRIEGVGPDGTWLLPLPGQSTRAFWDEFLFDFKEGKFRLNTALEEKGRKAYAAYLCKKFLPKYGKKLGQVRIYIEYLSIADPREALASGDHHGPVTQTYLLEERACGR